MQTEGWELPLSGSVPAELVWREMEIEATDPNSTELLRPYLQEKTTELPADLSEQQINTELRISRAVIHAKGSCLDEGMKSAQVQRFSVYKLFFPPSPVDAFIIYVRQIKHGS